MTPTRENSRRTSAVGLAGFARAAAFVVLAAATAAPAAAQLGAIRKKVRPVTGAPPAAVPQRPAPADAGGGTVVLSEDVVDRLIAGMRAAHAVRDEAAKEDTPFGRYRRAEAAYAIAKPKCEAGAQTYAQRLAADPKLMERNNALLEKMIAAQQKQDVKLQEAYADSVRAIQDPSCVVKEPQKPDDWHNLQSEVESRAEKKELEVSGYERRELGSIRDRAVAIIQDAPPPDVSQSEEDAVEKRSKELERLLGLEQVPAARAEKPVPPAAAPPPQPAATGMSPEQAALTDCMGKNARKHEKEIIRLGEKVQAAYESGNTGAAIAISDSIGKLQMAGCTGK